MCEKITESEFSDYEEILISIRSPKSTNLLETNGSVKFGIDLYTLEKINKTIKNTKIYEKFIKKNNIIDCNVNNTNSGVNNTDSSVNNTDPNNYSTEIKIMLSHDKIDEFEKIITNDKIQNTIKTYPHIIRYGLCNEKFRQILKNEFSIEFYKIDSSHYYYNEILQEYVFCNYLTNYDIFWNFNNRYFIQIPKNASQTIIHSFFENTSNFGHMLGKHFPVSNEILYVSCRNPVTRALSAYKFLCRGGHHNNIIYLLISLLFPTFDIWVKYGLCEKFLNHPGYSCWNEIFVKQVIYVTDNNGLSIIKKNNICKVENIYEDCIRLFGKPPIYYYNDSKVYHQPNDISITRDCVVKLQTLYREDFDFFDYEII